MTEALRLAREQMPRLVATQFHDPQAATAPFLQVPRTTPLARPEPTPVPRVPPDHATGDQPATPSSMAMAAVRLEPILKDLHSDDDSVRWRAVLALGAYGQGSRPALMALLDALADEEEAVRRAAVSALGRLGGAAREAVPALIDSLKDDLLREVAAESLVLIGLPAVPALLEAVQHGTSSVRWQAAEALTRIGRAS